MIATDNKGENNKKEEKKKTEQVTQDKEKPQEKKEQELNIKTQQDLSEIIYSKKDEQTKMNAYNQAIDKGILPRSSNYQEAVYAYEESVWIKNN
ncbi:hypothetical protein [Mammaliicoccus vitulinus]|uniref:hypothetical protein n=1 Tax=Mammaliicoccus vitulinus TaxID=71237 RepID=UPI001D022CE7|nr:hypothetical protein [Mammaliicoccus vitulinus]